MIPQSGGADDVDVASEDIAGNTVEARSSHESDMWHGASGIWYNHEIMDPSHPTLGRHQDTPGDVPSK